MDRAENRGSACSLKGRRHTARPGLPPEAARAEVKKTDRRWDSVERTRHRSNVEWGNTGKKLQSHRSSMGVGEMPADSGDWPWQE
jgi:hypothetical protein